MKKEFEQTENRAELTERTKECIKEEALAQEDGDSNRERSVELVES